ncbi:MAG: hypothetical protein A2X46_14215 [Lentisphaerae bacterium GWF2_57_35]|nr:MAG: hypothetical protein A2X46_14215 [Lentisphaerae bacterium GWF2_57_35]
MKVSNREIYLGWATLVAVLLAGTYWLGEAKLKEWDEFSTARQALNVRLQEAEVWANRQGVVDKSLDAIRQQLPRYPVGQDVTAELLKTLERTAQSHNLTLLRREPDKEKSVGDLYEVAINCSWEGELDALVHFLYALQVQGAMLDIRQLTITPGQGGPGRLKGNFTVDCAYSRESAGANTLKVESP